MKIYFVRHGETDMNARNMFYGWYDADINEKGIAQAEELRAAFETIHIDAIYSSDLKRAYHTAEIIANGREVQPVPEIRELYYGDWENRTWEEMSEADLEEWHGWLTDWVDRRMPNGEAFMEFYDRVTRGLEQIIKERLSKNASMGFGADLKDKFDKEKDILEKVTTEDLRTFGMIPEFLGRLPIIFTLKGLDEEMMVQILREPKNAILKQYQKLLALDEVSLDFDEAALHAIARKAMKKDTGARALRAIIEEFMLDIMYEIPKDDSIGQVTITEAYIEGTGGPLIQLRGQSVPQIEQH